MFCKNCGNEISDGSAFCVKCGTAINGVVNVNNNMASGENVSYVTQDVSGSNKPDAAGGNISREYPGGNSYNGMPKPTNAIAGKKTKNNKVILACAAIVALIVVLVVIISNRKTTVDLNKYINVNFDGYDSVGIAEVSFDRAAFVIDYSDKISYTKAFRNSDEYLMEATFGDVLSKDASASLFCSYCVNYSLDKGKELSNGDIVTLQWKCDEEAALEYFNCKMKYSDIEFEVAGLNEAKVVDPFENMEVLYTGIAPNGKADVKYTGNISGLSFEVENNGHFSNGDKATVKVIYSYRPAEETSLLQEGIILSCLKKEIVVEGLDAYLQKIDEVSDAALDAMNKQCSDILLTTLPKGLGDVWEIESDEYYGSYLLTAKSDDTWGNKNRLVIVHKVVVKMEYDGKKKASAKISYLFPVEYSDIMVLSDGTVSVDTIKGRKPQARFMKSYDIGEWWAKYFYFYGYDNTTSMFNEYVAKYVDKYEYESTVDDSGFEAMDEFIEG